jgi:hypothetical protein
MSQYQYYEFQAIDRPLDKAAQAALRSVSSRAQITPTSFTNEYNWGDFRGDARQFMEQWFDLHLYLANWGTRRLMMRVPKRFLDASDIDPFVSELEGVQTWTSGDDVIVDILHDEEEGYHDFVDGSGKLAALAPLRADVLSGDLRLFYLLWLTAVQDERVSDEDLEPLPGLGPLTPALEACAEFFTVDSDLAQAAAETGGVDAEPSEASLREALAAIAEEDKTELLFRLVQGDGHVAVELKRRLRGKPPAAEGPRRTGGELRKRAQEIANARARAEAERQAAERRRRAEEAEAVRRVRIESLKRRGAEVWSEIEQEIERRNAPGYEKAAELLADLQALAVEQGGQDDFRRRLAWIRERHERKGKFIERLDKLGLQPGPTLL